MNNKEAIDLIAMIKVKEPGEFIVNSWWGSFVNDYKEALQMAIKALEQEPCEDCISRQAVLDAIAANCIWENEYNLTSSRIKKAIEGLPSVNHRKTR